MSLLDLGLSNSVPQGWTAKGVWLLEARNKVPLSSWNIRNTPARLQTLRGVHGRLQNLGSVHGGLQNLGGFHGSLQNLSSFNGDFWIGQRDHCGRKGEKVTNPRLGCSRRVSATTSESTAMTLPMPSLMSSTATVGIVVVSLISIWIMSYVMDWLRILDAGTSTGERMPVLEDPVSLETMQFPSLFGPAEKYISLIIPAYNEAARLSSALDETLSYLQDRAKQDKTFTFEIIIVDDGSTDGTVKVAFEYVKKFKVDVIRVIKQGVNYGKGAAVRKGMLCSRGQLLLMLDADGATKITDLGKLENEIKLKASRATSSNDGTVPKLGPVPVAAFGSRAHLEKQALATRKWYRNVLMKGFHLLVMLVAGPGIRDTQCGFKMFTRSAARQLFLNMRLRRFAFDVELVFLCKRLNIPIQEVAVTWTEIPGSKIRFTSMFHMAFELVLVRLGYGFHVWKIHQRLAQD